MTPKLWACLSIFQEANHIEHTLKAANAWADAFIILDGAYRTFPDAGAGPSTDETLEIVERFKESTAGGRPFIVESRLWENQIEKRNRYLELVPDDDWVLVVDGDFQVVFYGDGYREYQENLTSRQYDAFQCRVIQQCGDQLMDWHWGNPLLFRKIHGLHYKYNHYSIYDEQERLFVPQTHPMRELQLIILESPRSPEHFKQIRSYQLEYQNELSNGWETFWCDGCKVKFRLNAGDQQLCPKCGQGGLSNPPVDVQALEAEKRRKSELLAAERPPNHVKSREN